MDEELLELQRQFELAQRAKSSIRLSDRNVVVLVQKLQGFDFKLLHTVSGKEYVTPIRYHEGIPLVMLFVHPSMIEMLNAASDDAIEHGTWFDALSVLPTSFGFQDVSKNLSLFPSVNTALKSNKALTFGELYIFSDTLIKV